MVTVYYIATGLILFLLYRYIYVKKLDIHYAEEIKVFHQGYKESILYYLLIYTEKLNDQTLIYKWLHWEQKKILFFPENYKNKDSLYKLIYSKLIEEGKQEEAQKLTTMMQPSKAYYEEFYRLIENIVRRHNINTEKELGSFFPKLQEAKNNLLNEIPEFAKFYKSKEPQLYPNPF